MFDLNQINEINRRAEENWKNGTPPRNAIFPDWEKKEEIVLKKNQRVNETEIETLKINPKNIIPD